MSIITVIAALALAALVIWAIGAPLARLGGALLAVASLICIISGEPITTRAPLLVSGVVLWLAGHLLTAYKTRTWSSHLAETLVTRTPLRYLDPVRGHEHRRTRREAAAQNAKPRIDRTAAPMGDFAQWERELAADTAPTAARTDHRVATRVPARPAGKSRGAVYGTRAAKAAGNLAVRKVPGARTARSVWRFVR